MAQSPLYSHPIQASWLTFALEVFLFTLDRAYFHWSPLGWLWTQSFFPGAASHPIAINISYGPPPPSIIPEDSAEEKGFCKYISSNLRLVGFPLNVSPHGGLQNILGIRGIGVKVKVLVTQSFLTLCNPMACSSPSSSVHGFLQTRNLEQFAISFSRGSPEPGIESRSPALQSLPSEPAGIASEHYGGKGREQDL